MNHRCVILSILPVLLAFARSTAQAADAPESGAFGVGRPGVMLEYSFGDSLGFSGGSADVQDIRILSPLWAKQDGDDIWSVAARYTGTFLDLGGAADLGSADLHAADLFFDYRRLPDRGFACWFRLVGSLSGDFSEISGDDFQASTMGLAGYRFSKEFGIVGGYHVAYLFDEIRIYGAVGVVWVPNDHWTFQITPPVPSISYSPTPSWSFSISAWPAGGAWDLDDRKQGAEDLELTLWRTALSVEHRLTDHFLIAVRAGMNFASEIEIRDHSDKVLLGKSLDDALFGAVAVRYSF